MKQSEQGHLRSRAGLASNLMRHRRRGAKFVCTALACIVVGVPCWAQASTDPGAPDPGTQTPTPPGSPDIRYVQPFDTPMPLKPYIRALGERIQKPGKERVVMAGIMTDQAGTHNTQATFQLPGEIRIDNKDNGTSLGFDGATAWSSEGQLAEDGAGVLDSLAADAPEAFFYALASGAALRSIGVRFYVSGSMATTAQWVDVFELTALPKVRGGTGWENRFFYFDSVTHLLRRVRHQTGQHVVDTLLDGWQNIGGEWVPTQWTRLQDGQVVFSFAANGVSLAARSSGSGFSKP